MYRLLFCIFLILLVVMGEVKWKDDDDSRPPCATVCEERDDQKAENCCREQGFSTGYCRPWGVAHCLGERHLRYRRHKKIPFFEHHKIES